jgi:ribosomal protein L32
MADETAPPAVKPKVGLRGKDKILPPNIVVEDCPNCGRQKLVGTVCMCQKFNEMGRRELRKMDLGE